VENAVTIEQFHALLSSKEAESPLLKALRKLKRIEEPEKITALDAVPLQHWGGWGP
jgi:hypothetical protein